MRTRLVIAPLLLVCVACASSGAIPREVIDARDAYRRAAAGPGLELAPAHLHTARLALDRAEEALDQEGDSPHARDLAYIAERLAQVAESAAGSALARSQQERSEKLLAQLQIQQAQRAVRETQAELERAQLKTEAALSQLTSLRGAVARDERGLVISLTNDLLFERASARLLPTAQRRLNEIAQTLVGPGASAILIEGQGSRLAQRRAEAVANYLAKKGVPRTRLTAQARSPNEMARSTPRVDIVVGNLAAASR